SSRAALRALGAAHPRRQDGRSPEHRRGRAPGVMADALVPATALGTQQPDYARLRHLVVLGDLRWLVDSVDGAQAEQADALRAGEPCSRREALRLEGRAGANPAWRARGGAGPQPQHAVGSAAREPLTIRAERHTPESTRVASDRGQRRTVARGPETDHTVI